MKIKKFNEDFRYSDENKEKERIARFDIRKAFLEQIVHNKNLGNISGAWFKTQEPVQKAFVLSDHNGHLGVIEYDYIDGKLVPMVDTMILTPEEIQENINKFAH